MSSNDEKMTESLPAPVLLCECWEILKSDAKNEYTLFTSVV